VRIIFIFHNSAPLFMCDLGDNQTLAISMR
jgi:hypothetical protein